MKNVFDWKKTWFSDFQGKKAVSYYSEVKKKKKSNQNPDEDQEEKGEEVCLGPSAVVWCVLQIVAQGRVINTDDMRAPQK